MQSRFPTPENIGAAPFQSTLVSKVPNVGQTSEMEANEKYYNIKRAKPTEEMMQKLQAELKGQVSSEQGSLMPTQQKPANNEYPTLSKVLLDRQNILGKISNRIGLTKKDIQIIEKKFFPNVGSKVDDIAIVLLTIALIMPIATKNKEWERIASFAKEIQEKGAVALRDSLPEQSYELAIKIAESIENGQISPEIQAQISQISSVPQVQASLPSTSDDSQIADVADVTDMRTPITEVTATPEATGDTFSLTIDGITVAENISREELEALAQASKTLPTLISENEKLKKEVEAAKKSASTSKYIAMGLGISILVGGGYWYYTTKQQD